MPVTPTSPHAIALHSLCVAASISPTFQSWTGTANEAAALARTHLYSPPPPADPQAGYTVDELQALRPMAIITSKPPAVVSRSIKAASNSQTAMNHFLDRYSSYVHFVDEVDEEMDWRDIFVDFTNKYDNTVQDMISLGHERSDTPYVSEVSLVVEPTLTSEIYHKTQGKFIECIVAFNTGLRG